MIYSESSASNLGNDDEARGDEGEAGGDDEGKDNAGACDASIRFCGRWSGLAVDL